MGNPGFMTASHPLAGLTIVVTRPRDQAAQLRDRTLTQAIAPLSEVRRVTFENRRLGGEWRQRLCYQRMRELVQQKRNKKQDRRQDSQGQDEI